jgi:hypothetical protein
VEKTQNWELLWSTELHNVCRNLKFLFLKILGVFLFDGTGVWTQDFIARPSLYPLSHSTSPEISFYYFFDHAWSKLHIICLQIRWAYCIYYILLIHSSSIHVQVASTSWLLCEYCYKHGCANISLRYCF